MYSLCIITTTPQGFNSYILSNWSEFSSFVSYNTNLLNWFENFEYFKRGINENRDGIQLLKEIYICIFGDFNDTSKDEYISKLFYSSSIKHDVQSILELKS